MPHVLIGLCLLAILPVHTYIRAMGHPISAVVDDVVTTTGRNGKKSYRAQFHYVLDGQRRDDDQSLTETEAGQLHQGSALPGRAVVVLGHAIFLANLDGPSTQTWSLVAMTLFWNGIVGYAVYTLWIVPIRNRLLLETGVATPGTFVSERRYRGKSGPNVYVRYRFETPQGPVETSTLVTGKALQRLDATQPITVVYDPAKPKRSTVFEYSGYALRPMVG